MIDQAVKAWCKKTIHRVITCNSVLSSLDELAEKGYQRPANIDRRIRLNVAYVGAVPTDDIAAALGVAKEGFRVSQRKKDVDQLLVFINDPASPDSQQQLDNLLANFHPHGSRVVLVVPEITAMPVLEALRARVKAPCVAVDFTQEVKASVQQLLQTMQEQRDFSHKVIKALAEFEHEGTPRDFSDHLESLLNRFICEYPLKAFREIVEDDCGYDIKSVKALSSNRPKSAFFSHIFVEGSEGMVQAFFKRLDPFFDQDPVAHKSVVPGSSYC